MSHDKYVLFVFGTMLPKYVLFLFSFFFFFFFFFFFYDFKCGFFPTNCFPFLFSPSLDLKYGDSKMGRFWKMISKRGSSSKKTTTTKNKQTKRIINARPDRGWHAACSKSERSRSRCSRSWTSKGAIKQRCSHLGVHQQDAPIFCTKTLLGMF